jgi:hypothetical protein
VHLSVLFGNKHVVPISFREGFYAGLAVALCIGLFLGSLWRPERQIQRHSENLLRAIEKKDWTRFAFFVSGDYQDQWGNDHALLLQSTREVFRSVRMIRLNTANPRIWITNHSGFWEAKITTDGDGGEIMMMIKQRINSLVTPFRLEWRRMSGKPWDWKLVRGSNADLQIPSEFQ